MSDVRALVFDVFGTVVDWRASVIREGEAIGRAKGVSVDWGAFADRWRREGYSEATARIRRGEAPWATADQTHRAKLDELLPLHGLGDLSPDEVAEFNRVWHRLAPWPDAVRGLTRLRVRYTVSTLSNGNFALLVGMAKHSGLPWDCILSADLLHAYKPDPAMYLGAARLLGLEPGQVMMVAAHGGDLQAAAALGLRTAFVRRPYERGPDGAPEPEPEGQLDYRVNSFLELADALRA